jgi:hypothetical protein
MQNVIAWVCACSLSMSCGHAANPEYGNDASAATMRDEPAGRDAGGGALPQLDARSPLAIDNDRDTDAGSSGMNVPTVVDSGRPEAGAATDASVLLPASDAGAPCTNAAVSCSGRCTDVRSDSAHCGDCATSCSAGFGCHEGRCQAEVGCSDGTREAFASLARHPTIAGCAATWPRASMRAPKTGASCGDNRGACVVPADACAAGWHVCGDDARGPEDLSSRVSHAECYAEKGNWAVALGDHSCTDCGSTSSGAVCCGDGCVQQQGDCVWLDATGWFGVVHDVINLCSAIANEDPSIHVGVLCCRSAVGQ